MANSSPRIATRNHRTFHDSAGTLLQSVTSRKAANPVYNAARIAANHWDSRMTEALIVILEKWGALDRAGLLVLAPVFFICATVLPVPRTALCLGSGAIFGLSAIPVIVPSTTLGAVVAFLLARYLFAARLRMMTYRSTKLRIILNAIDDEGWRVVGLMRFAGPVPNFLQNLMFGLTRIGLWPFTAATFICTIPQICLYV
jgi:uncharacterized membrane protein YdjX (TVP38/TMEM64 family)